MELQALAEPLGEGGLLISCRIARSWPSRARLHWTCQRCKAHTYIFAASKSNVWLGQQDSLSGAYDVTGACLAGHHWWNSSQGHKKILDWVSLRCSRHTPSKQTELKTCTPPHPHPCTHTHTHLAKPRSATRAWPAPSMKTLLGLRSRCKMGGCRLSSASMPCATWTSACVREKEMDAILPCCPAPPEQVHECEKKRRRQHCLDTLWQVLKNTSVGIVGRWNGILCLADNTQREWANGQACSAVAHCTHTRAYACKFEA